MKRELFRINCRVGGVTKGDRGNAERVWGASVHGKRIGGVTEFCMERGSGRKVFNIFLNSRQSDSDFLNSFMHEMVHVVIKLMGMRVGKRKQEFLAEWAGYLSGLQFAKVMPWRFGLKGRKVV